MPLRGASRAIRHRRATECAPRPTEVPARGSPTARPSGCVSRGRDRIVLAASWVIAHSFCERRERVRRPRRCAHPSTSSSTVVRSTAAASTLELPSTPRSLRSQSLCAVDGLPPARDRTGREVATRRPPYGQPRAPTTSGRGAHSVVRLCLIARLAPRNGTSRSLWLRGYGPPSAGLRSLRRRPHRAGGRSRTQVVIDRRPSTTVVFRGSTRAPPSSRV